MTNTHPAPRSAAGALLLLPRRVLHVSMLGLAFLLPFLSWAQAAVGAVLALLFDVYVLPALEPDLGKRVRDPISTAGIESAQDVWTGIILYPSSMLALILVFRHHLEVVAAAWAIMALGDGAAAVAGQRLKSRALPWNPDKTVAGFAAFVLAATPSALGLALWVNPGLAAGKTLLISFLAALLGAAVESAPLGLDDNLTVPLACGGFIFCASLVERSALDGNLPYLGRRLILAVVVNLTFALIAVGLKAASRSGAALGFVLGTLVYLGWGWKSFLILVAFFLLGSVATRLGYSQKLARGVAEPRRGARSWREALANVGPGAFFALLVITTHQESAFLVAFVAAFAEAAGDTVSSEIGQWLAPDAYLITSFRRVLAGENGGVSLAGSAAGLLASGLIVALAWQLGLVTAAGAGVALAAAVAGNLCDSVLGASIERRGLATNGLVNFASTAFAGALAFAVTLR